MVKDKKVIILLLAAAICSIIVFLYPLNTRKTIAFELNGLSFNSHSSDTVISKVKEFKGPVETEPKSFFVSFKVKAADDYYGNIFQTANDPITLRLELTKPNTLSLILGHKVSDLQVHKITDDFKLNIWHDVTLTINEVKEVVVNIDGQNMLSFTDKSIVYDVNDVAVGTGYNKQRGFQGEIGEFHMRCERFQRQILLEVIDFAIRIIPIIAFLFFVHIWLGLINGLPLYPGSMGVSEVLFIPGITVIFVVIGIVMEMTMKVTSHWIPFFLVGFGSLLLPGLYDRIFNHDSLSRFKAGSRILASCAFVLAVGLLIFSAVSDLNEIAVRRHDVNRTAVLLFFLFFGITTLLTLSFSGYQVWVMRDGKRTSFSLLIILFSFISWLAISDLPNGIQLFRSLTAKPYVSVAVFTLFTAVTYGYLFRGPSPVVLPSAMNGSESLKRVLGILFVAAAVLIFFLMSFRFDTLFLGAEYHWEYFVGPVRTIKEGSWLLWDTPSQYGFLSILIPALLPIESPWESLYVFQGALLLLVSVLLLRTYLLNRFNGFGILFSVLVVFSSLFFADPDLIGPYLYPSSSVMRFFWCYILLSFFFLSYSNAFVNLRRVVSIGTILWLLGFAWSSESAIYSTIVFFPAITTAVLQDYYRRLNDMGSRLALIKHLFSYLSTPVISLFSVIAVIAIYYKVRISQFPDFYAFVEYGLSYAGGFGSVDLKPFGAVWILIILFATIGIVTVRLVLRDPGNKNLVVLVAALGCLWSISSYFIGRSVPQNITAILPILGLISMIALHSAEAGGPDHSHVILKAVAAPLFILIFMTCFGNFEFVDKMRNFRTLTAHIADKINTAPEDLQELIEKANIQTTDAVVYYGYNGLVPRWKIDDKYGISNRTWMPNPLQIIEEPITEARRRTYVRRFVERSKRGGFLIMAKGEAEDRAANWIDIINGTHKATQNFENERWKVTYYELR